LSSVFEDQIFALDIAFFYNSPAFVFSGYTFPKFGMPVFDQFYAQLIPYTHFLGSFFKIYQMNVSSGYLKSDIYPLLIFLTVGLIFSYVALKIKVKKFYKLKPVLNETY
jgi:ABC-2 type transport system permease protein